MVQYNYSYDNNITYLSKMLEDILGQFFMCVKFLQVQRKDKNILIFIKRGVETCGNCWLNKNQKGKSVMVSIKGHWRGA